MFISKQDSLLKAEYGDGYVTWAFIYQERMWLDSMISIVSSKGHAVFPAGLVTTVSPSF